MRKVKFVYYMQDNWPIKYAVNFLKHVEKWNDNHIIRCCDFDVASSSRKVKRNFWLYQKHKRL